MMPLIAPPTTRWIVFWTNLATALILFLTVLTLVFQKDMWIMIPLAGGVILFNTAMSLYDLQQQSDYHRQRLAFR